MNEVEEEVISALKDTEAGRGVAVLLTCVDDCSLVKRELETQGVKIDQVFADFNTMMAKVEEKHLTFLQNSNLICAVELDQEVKTH